MEYFSVVAAFTQSLLPMSL